MPLVVEEVVIRVQVEDSAARAAPKRPSSPEEKRALIAEVVEQVLEILRRREEP